MVKEPSIKAALQKVRRRLDHLKYKLTQEVVGSDVTDELLRVSQQEKRLQAILDREKSTEF